MKLGLVPSPSKIQTPFFSYHFGYLGKSAVAPYFPFLPMYTYLPFFLPMILLFFTLMFDRSKIYTPKIIFVITELHW